MKASQMRQRLSLSVDGLQAAFVAFGHVGTDAENQTLLLKLMGAIEAYLIKVASKSDSGKLQEAIASFVAMGFSEEDARKMMEDTLRDAPSQGSA
jgi:Holliday junction resolvasome RuvABC DNA-binding subunit